MANIHRIFLAKQESRHIVATELIKNGYTVRLTSAKRRKTDTRATGAVDYWLGGEDTVTDSNNEQ